MDKLNFKIVDAKPFRSAFISSVVMNVVLALGAFLIIRGIVPITPPFIISNSISQVAMYVVIIGSFLYINSIKSKTHDIAKITDFNEKMRRYERLSKQRYFAYLYSAFVSAILMLVSFRMVFFYFTLVDILLVIPFYPSLRLFRTELKDEEIVFS
ncbi:MAG: hypothetical protein EOO09_00425 [Chitinophagaceae bacterium]|nr:MAG: hypothetical protein EOO09_00425 [Chitinophagaceae bacterium]